LIQLKRDFLQSVEHGRMCRGALCPAPGFQRPEEVNMRIPNNVLLLAFACAATAPAFGYESGDVIVRAGLAKVSPDVSTDAATTGIDVDNYMQLGLTATWMLSPQFGVELLAATPFKHDISATGTTIGSTRQLPPTISAQ
jgi:outer membrane protein